VEGLKAEARLRKAEGGKLVKGRERRGYFYVITKEKSQRNPNRSWSVGGFGEGGELYEM